MLAVVQRVRIWQMCIRSWMSTASIVPLLLPTGEAKSLWRRRVVRRCSRQGIGIAPNRRQKAAK